jgi:hypothetical protein
MRKYYVEKNPEKFAIDIEDRLRTVGKLSDQSSNKNYNSIIDRSKVSYVELFHKFVIR